MYRSVGFAELIILLGCLAVFVAIVAALGWFLLRPRLGTGKAIRRRDGEMPQVMTVDEVAAALRVDTEAVVGLIQDGRLPAVKVGQDWRVSRRNVIAFIDRGGDAQKKGG
jgi:excisionase family DNA binding protein